jgi:hypothetical protein
MSHGDEMQNNGLKMLKKQVFQQEKTQNQALLSSMMDMATLLTMGMWVS